MAKNLDQELEQALRATDDDAARAVVAPPRGDDPSRSNKQKNVGLLVGLLVVAAGIVGLTEPTVTDLGSRRGAAGCW